MDISHLCAGIKSRVALELQQAPDAAEKHEVLIRALYEVSRSALPALGTPRKSLEYRSGQEVVLELISSIAIPLIRGGDERGVAVFSEIAEGCQDPLLKKKLSVYAQQLLVQSRVREGHRGFPAARSAAWLIGSCAAVAVMLYLAWPGAGGGSAQPASALTSAPAASSAAAPGPSPSGTAAAPEAPIQARPAPAPRPAELGEPQLQGEQKATIVSAPAAPGAEQVTRVRILNNQVLVPVLLKHGAASVRLELVLDTGATRTAVHEAVAARLALDLRSARSSQAELADGRMIRSRLVKVDALSVGPFVHPLLELELIPYSGRWGEHDGLLGMDVLGRHRYQIDMEHELIRWF